MTIAKITVDRIHKLNAELPGLVPAGILKFPRFLFVVLSLLFLYTVSPAQIPCENSIRSLNGAATEFKNSVTEGGLERLILIAQLGAKEKRRELNTRRLFAARKFLISLGIESERIVTAAAETSERVEFGVIAIYINGKVLDIIFINADQDLRVRSCANLKEDQLFQMPKPKARRPVKSKNRENP